MYFLYRLLSEGFCYAGVIVFFTYMTQIQSGNWNMILGAVIMFVLFGIQALVNRTVYVKKLKHNLLRR